MYENCPYLFLKFFKLVCCIIPFDLQSQNAIDTQRGKNTQGEGQVSEK